MGEAGRSIHPRLLTHGSSKAGRQASIVAGLALFVWLVPAFAVTASEARWDPVLLGSLAAIAITSYFGAVAFRTTNALDGAFIAALVGVVLLGPLPGACIWIATEIGAFLVQRRRLEAFVANAVSFAAATLVAAVVLALLAGKVPVDESLGATGYAVVALAGVAMLIENFIVGAVLIDVLRDRRPLVPVVWAELVTPAPATMAMIAIGTATVFLYAQVGVLALVLFALVVVVPQLLLPRLLRPLPVHALYHTRAVAVYAQAIGKAMRLSRSDRLVLKDAAAYMRECPLRSPSGKLSDTSTGHRLALVEAVLYHGENWDGNGGTPGAVGGEMIPLLSRILAVADAWAGVTAKGSPQLGHYQALHQLEARAGMHFDPRVVAAARRVVEQEGLAFDEQDAHQPSVARGVVWRAGRRLGSLLGDPLTV